MKKALLYLHLLLFPLSLKGQVDCPLFKTYIDKGEVELRKGDKADIKIIIDAFINAMVHCPSKAAEARNKIVKAFDAIKNLKIQAEKNAILALKAQKATENALAQAENARKKAQATLDKIYFYNDNFGLAYQNYRYGYIDKNLQTKIDFKYDDASAFDYDGWAKVKRDNSYYLIDTTGTEYTLATDTNQLNATITALDLRSKNLIEIPKAVFEQTQLKVLLLSRNQIRKLQGLEKLINLQILEISYNQIDKLQGLEKLTNLQTLDISFNLIDRIEGLENLTALESLHIQSNNNIGTIEGLKKLISLKSLYISSNKISRIEGLETLTALQSLYISSNLISEIEGLDSLVALQTLGISSNKISRIHGLENLVALQSLYISLNQFSSIDGLEKLSDLRKIEFFVNHISEMEKEKIKKKLPNCRIHKDNSD